MKVLNTQSTCTRILQYLYLAKLLGYTIESEQKESDFVGSHVPHKLRMMNLAASHMIVMYLLQLGAAAFEVSFGHMTSHTLVYDSILIA